METSAKYSHKLPGQHVYNGILFFEFSPPDILDAMKDFQVREDDVFIVTYPKAGTTWMQEILWLIMNKGNFEEANQKQVYFRSPFLEFKDTTLNEVGLDLAAPMPSPRVIKTHLYDRLAPRMLFQQNIKTVVVFRNPKDLCVSYYHFYRSSSSVGNFKGSWEEFLSMFLDGHVDHGSWFDFTRGWWSQRERSHVKIVYYEDMKQNLNAVIDELCTFVDVNLDKATMQEIAKHCSFKQMKENPMTNHLDVYSINSSISPLLRKGEVGDWKNHFTVAQSEYFDIMYQEKMGDLDIPFKYEI